MTKMKRTIAVVVTAAGFVVMASAAQALNSVSLIWRLNGTDSVSSPTVTGSSLLIADIVLTADAAGVSGIGISIAFDTSELLSIGSSELSSVNLPGMGNAFTPLAPGTTVDNVNGVISGFEQADLTGVGLVSSTATLGSVRFHVVNPANGLADIDAIANMSGGPDGIVNSVGGGLPDPTFNGAYVTGAPEPTTAVLLLAGLAGLGYAGRRSLR